MNTNAKIPRFTESMVDKIRRDPPCLLDVPTLAVFLDQSERKTWDDIRLGRIPHFRLGGRVLVRRIDLEAAIERLVVGRPRSR